MPKSKRSAKKPSKYVFVHRSAENGHFVSKAFAEANPKTTTRHRSLRKVKGSAK